MARVPGNDFFFLDFPPKRIQSTTLGLKLMFWVVSHHLVAAKCSFAKSCPGIPFWHEFVLTKLLSSFLAKMHPIHYFRSKTHILGGFAPFVCSKCTVAKSVPRLPFWHESRPTKLSSSFSAETHPIHYVQSKTHALCVFTPFGYRKCTFAKSVPWMPFWHEFGPTKLLSSFSAKTHPIH